MTPGALLKVGPAGIPIPWIIIAGIVCIAWLAGWLFLPRGSRFRTAFTSLFGSTLLPFVLAWKFSLLITDARDVLANPKLMIFASGSGWNVLIGILVGTGWAAYLAWKTPPGRAVVKALSRSVAVGIFLGLPAWLILSVGPRDAQGTPPLPDVPLEQLSGGIWLPSMARGRPVVLNFWASWCPPCRAEMPMLDRLAGDGRWEETVFVAVNAATTEKNPGAGPAWMEENGFMIPVLMDATGKAAGEYRIESLPTTIVLDRAGRMTARKTGAVSRRWLISAIRRASRGEIDDD